MIGLALIGLSGAANASGSPFDCESIKASATDVRIYDKPSVKALKDAARIYMSSPSIGKCLYPDVTIKRIPVGEYESTSDAPITTVTLTGRTEYSWGHFKLQLAMLEIPEGYILSTTPNLSNQILVEAVNASN